MIHLTIFASGSGSNAGKIMEYFEQDRAVTVGAVFSNKPDAYVLQRAKDFGVPTEVFDRSQFDESKFSKKLDAYLTDYIILAGFLWKIPSHLIKAFHNRIVNIHPALLPKYGGKGMYGHHVHQAVIEHQEEKSGMTIHLVNEHYDEGKILFQDECEVKRTDTSKDLANRILELEHMHFPRVIKEFVMS